MIKYYVEFKYGGYTEWMTTQELPLVDADALVKFFHATGWKARLVSVQTIKTWA